MAVAVLEGGWDGDALTGWMEGEWEVALK